MFTFSTKAFSISINKTENLADLTAVYIFFIFLKHDRGYSQIPDREIEKAIFYFAQSNYWDISNFNEDIYDNLKILIPRKNKCLVLANNALALFAYVK